MANINFNGMTTSITEDNIEEQYKLGEMDVNHWKWLDRKAKQDMVERIKKQQIHRQITCEAIEIWGSND